MRDLQTKDSKYLQPPAMRGLCNSEEIQMSNDQQLILLGMGMGALALNMFDWLLDILEAWRSQSQRVSDAKR